MDISRFAMKLFIYYDLPEKGYFGHFLDAQLE
jgi:hypothetical protein